MEEQWIGYKAGVRDEIGKGQKGGIDKRKRGKGGIGESKRHKKAARPGERAERCRLRG